ncbi:hypothetical protein [Rubellicoccus peritrichatus]|uniref:Uncharacterized protein n=1 Tax=Rubellicoccus peritrichatus TaxID=3080537 RepID=A0AAQ3L8C1_9BACT|nr:hypothetical protein [Puniceicoccus sp. CR14]WOO41180.1 hypothetical protein RZN69_21375 [Puniceicoccus sp. CR14]
MAITDHLKHKTIGVSFPPELRLRAAERARSLSLSFSKYVTLCIESELEGRPPQGMVENLLPKGSEGLDLDDAIEKGKDYSVMKAASIGFEDDIEAILKEDEFNYKRAAPAAHLRTDFLVYKGDPENSKTPKIALECKFNIAKRSTIALGQAVILKALPEIKGVVLCVPYLKHFDSHVRDAFQSQGIPVATPDTVSDVIREAFNKKGR